MEDLGQRDISSGRRDVWRVYELLEELPSIALHNKEILDCVRIKISDR